jgi:hypothetical protein
MATRSALGASKSGKPCDKLIAPTSFAKEDIVVKMVVPTLGSFVITVA